MTSSTYAHTYLLPVLIDLLGPRRRILDLGCGDGSLARALTGRGHEVFGVDAWSDGIAMAEREQPGHFFEMDLNDGALPPGIAGREFDCAISIEVIEHLYRPSALLDVARSALRPGRELIVSTPYHGYLKNLGLSLLNGWDRHQSPLWDGGHIKFWSRSTLEQVLRQNGWDALEFRGAGRLPWLWKSMVVRAGLLGT